MTTRILNDINNLKWLNNERRKLKEMEQLRIKDQIKGVQKEIQEQASHMHDIQEQKDNFRNYTYNHTLKNKINKKGLLSIEKKFLTFDSAISKVNRERQESENKLSELKDEGNKITKQINKHLIKSEKYIEIEKLIK